MDLESRIVEAQKRELPRQATAPERHFQWTASDDDFVMA